MGAATPVKITFPDSGDENELQADILAFTVERDVGQPDMAAVVLSNQESHYSTKAKVYDQIEIKVGDDVKSSIFKGRIVGLEAMYKGNEKARLTIRSMNAMHELLRKRKSLTFVDKTDKQIIEKVASDAGLSLDWHFKDGEPPKYKHVYQHNQTDLEFIRMRAARLGMHVWCKDQKLYVWQPKLEGDGDKLEISKTDAEGAVKMFNPRMNSSSIVHKVTVKGWNPETKELIEGDFTATNSKLGKEDASKASKKFGTEETFTVDHPIWTKDEAKALARGRLTDLNLSFITGECEVNGDPKYDLGGIVNITANQEEEANDPFNGKYYIMGVTHRYKSTKNKDGGYQTILRLARDAQKKP